MANESTENPENTSFYDQADQTFNRKLNEKEIKLAKGVKGDEETEEEEASEFGGSAEQQVRQTEDASLQDESYSFDESNTDNEEYHDADDADDNHLESENDLLH